MPIPPSPEEIKEWVKTREAKLRMRGTWAYTKMMNLTAEYVNHDILTIGFPYLWYRADLADSFDAGDRRAFNTSFQISTSYIASKSRGKLLFIQFLRNHFQSIVFLSTRINVPDDRRIIHHIDAWERHVWLMMIARYWGAPQRDVEDLERWIAHLRCRFVMPDGSFCAEDLGHDPSIIPHNHRRRQRVVHVIGEGLGEEIIDEYVE
jgi:hypothetical protein